MTNKAQQLIYNNQLTRIPTTRQLDAINKYGRAAKRTLDKVGGSGAISTWNWQSRCLWTKDFG